MKAIVRGMVLLAMALVTTLGWTADVTLKAHDAGGHSAFLSGTNWSDGNPPTGANDYIAAYNLRTPANANAYTFGGRSLRLDPGGVLLFKGSNVITVSYLKLNGGTVWQGSGGATPDIVRLAGGIDVLAPSFFATDVGGRTIDIQSSFTGKQAVVFRTTYTTGPPFTNLLRGANGYFEGPMVIADRAVVVVDGESRLGTNGGPVLVSDLLTLTNGGNLYITTTGTFDDPQRGVTFRAGPNHPGGQITVAGGQTVWWKLPMAGDGLFIKSGDGTMNLRVISNVNANTYSGGTIVEGGLLNVYTRQALGSGDLVVTNAGRIQLFSRSFGGTVVNVYSGTVAFSAANGANGATINLNGYGSRLLVGARGATNGATVNWGDGAIVQWAYPELLPQTPVLVTGSRMVETYPNSALPIDSRFVNAIDPNSDGLIGIGVNNAVGVLDLSGHPNLQVGAAQNVSYWGFIVPSGTAYRFGGNGLVARLVGNTGLSIGTLTGAYDVVIGSTGVVTLVAGNTFSGRIIVTNGGWLVVNSGDNSWGIPPSNFETNIILNGGGIRLQNAVQFTIPATRGMDLGPAGGEINIWSGTAKLAIEAPIFGPGELYFSDAGTAVLLATNTYEGGTRSGTFLQLGNSMALSTGKVTITGAQGGLGSASSSPVVVSNDVTLNSNVTFGHPIQNGTLTLVGKLDLGNTMRLITNRSSTVIAGQVTNGGMNVIVQNNSSLTLSGDNRFEAGFRITGGTLALGHDNALGTSTGWLDNVRVVSSDASTRTLTNWLTIAGAGVTLGAPGTGDLVFDHFVNNGTVGKEFTIDSITATFNYGLTNTGVITFRGNGTVSLGSTGVITRASQVIIHPGVTLDVSAQAAFTRTTGTLEGGGTILGNVGMAGGTVLVPGTSNGAQVLTINGNLTMTSTTTNRFQVGGTPTWIGASDRVDVTGDLEPNGAVILLQPISAMSAGTHTLFTYGGSKSTTFTLGTSSPGVDVRYGWTGLSEGSGVVGLVVTGSSMTLTYDGFGNPVWDTKNTAAWNGGSEMFYRFDRVVFDDSGAPGSVTLSGVLQPSGIIVSGSQNYAFTGTGSISGWTDLEKSGNGTLTIGTANSFTGTVRVLEGVLLAIGASALGSPDAGGTVVTNGGAMHLLGVNVGAEWIRLSGSGVNGQGALVATGLTAATIQRLSLDGNATVGTPDGSRLDLRGGAARFVEFNGYTLTKVGTGLLVFADTVFSNAGQLVVSQGVLAVEGNTRSVGVPGEIVFPEGSTLALSGAGGNPSYLWTNVMQGGVIGNYARIGLTHTDGSVYTPCRLESNTAMSFIGGTMTFWGSIHGPGQLLITNTTGTIVLNGTNFYAGGTLVTSGRLQVAGASVLPLGTGPVNVRGDDNGQLWVAGAARVTNAVTIRGLGWNESAGHLGAIRLSGTGLISGPVIVAADSRIVAYAGGDSGEISGSIVGTNITLELNRNDPGKTLGSGTITLSGNNSGFYGSMSLYAGTLRLGNDQALGTGTFVWAGGRIVPTGLVARTIPNDVLLSNVTVSIGGGHPMDRGPITFNGVVTGWAAAVQIEGFNPVTFNAIVASTGTIRIVGANSVTFNGTIKETSGLIANGYGGTIFLNAANTYTGDTIVAGKNLVLGNAGAIPSGAGRGNLVVSGGILDLNGFTPSFNGLGGTATITDSVGTVTTVTVGQNNATSSFSGALSGSLTTLQKVGSGLLGLPRGLNGNVDVQAGRVQVNGTVQGMVSVAGGATLEINGNGLLGQFYMDASLTQDNEEMRVWSPEYFLASAATTNLVLEAASSLRTTTFSFGGATAPLLPPPFDKGSDRATQFSAIWQGKFVAPTNGTYVFATRSDDASSLWVDEQLVVYNNRYQGATTRSGEIYLTAGEHDIVILYRQGGGGLELDARLSGSAIPNSLLKLADVVSIGSLTGAPTATLSLPGTVPARIVQTMNGVFAGQVTGSGPLIKDGSSTLRLTGASPGYVGTIAVTSGVLQVDGTLTGAGLIVYNGGTLSGVGTVNNVSVQMGGVLSPGASPGILTANGNVTLESGSTLKIEINGLTLGVDYDQLFLANTTLTLNNPGLQVLLGFSPSIGDSFTIVSGFSTLSGQFNGLPDGSVFSVGSTQFQIDYEPNDIVLTVVPEPSTLGTLLLGTVLLRLRRSLRRSNAAI
jgi:autotransporter-associated beta strand protein